MNRIELFNHLLKIIFISYLKPYNYLQIVHIRLEYLMELLMLNKNTWNLINVGKQMIEIK